MARAKTTARTISGTSQPSRVHSAPLLRNGRDDNGSSGQQPHSDDESIANGENETRGTSQPALDLDNRSIASEGASIASSSESHVDWTSTRTILVGSQKQSYSIHYSFLIAAGPKLDDAVELEGDTLVLKKVKPRVFEHFLGWCYGYHLPSHGDLLSSPPTSDWLRLYVFAERVGSLALMRALMVKLYYSREYITEISLEDCAIVFNRKPHQSMLKTFVKDWWMVQGTKSDFKADFVRKVPDLAAWLVRSMLGHRPHGPDMAEWNFQELPFYLRETEMTT